MADKKLGNVLKPNELSTFCAQIAMVLKAGIGVSEGVSVMMEDVKGLQTQEILAAIHEKLELGIPLYQALESTGVFPGYMVNMTEIGEKTGKLDDVMDSLTDYYEREEAISESIKSAVTYPMVMILVMALVVGVMIIYVLPVFNEVFVDLGSEITGFAKTVMDLGAVLVRYSAVIVGALIAAVIGFVIYRRVKRQTGIPMTRSMNSKIASGRFASAMSMMISSGLDSDESLDMVYRLTENRLVRGRIELCRDHISGGATFADALVKSELFSGIYSRMVAVGFKTGSIDQVMKKVAERYEEEIDVKIRGLVAVLEPTLVAVLSILVGLILMSVMLPLMGVMSTIG